jgi:hypothetical protein
MGVVIEKCVKYLGVELYSELLMCNSVTVTLLYSRACAILIL